MKGIIFATIVVLLSLVFIPNANAWWNTTWIYRENITINNSANPTDLYNYPVQVNISYNLSANCLGFSCYRAVNSSDNGELDFWRDTMALGDWAYFFVEVPFIQASSTTFMYVYYGNTSPVVDKSNGANVFIKYDGIEDGDTTDAGDLWVQSGNYANTTQKHSGSYSMRVNYSLFCNLSTSLGSLPLNKTAIGFWFKRESGDFQFDFLNSSASTCAPPTCWTSNLADFLFNDSLWRFDICDGAANCGASWYNNSGLSFSQSYWNRVEYIPYTNSSGHNVYNLTLFNYTDFNNISAKPGRTPANYAGDVDRFHLSIGAAQVGFLDDFFVRNYSYPEPTTYITAIESSGTETGTVTINSPTNTTYNMNYLWFNVTTDFDLDHCLYSLDGAANATLTNDTLTHAYLNKTSLTNATYGVKFFCNTTGFGTSFASSTVYFTINTNPPAAYCKNITFDDTMATEVDRINEPTEVWINSTHIANCVNEIRVYDTYCGNNGNEIPYQVIGQSGMSNCKILFFLNRTAGTNVTWSAYYGNSELTQPTYVVDPYWNITRTNSDLLTNVYGIVLRNRYWYLHTQVGPQDRYGVVRDANAGVCFYHQDGWKFDEDGNGNYDANTNTWNTQEKGCGQLPAYIDGITYWQFSNSTTYNCTNIYNGTLASKWKCYGTLWNKFTQENTYTFYANQKYFLATINYSVNTPGYSTCVFLRAISDRNPQYFSLYYKSIDGNYSDVYYIHTSDTWTTAYAPYVYERGIFGYNNTTSPYMSSYIIYDNNSAMVGQTWASLQYDGNGGSGGSGIGHIPEWTANCPSKYDISTSRAETLYYAFYNNKTGNPALAGEDAYNLSQKLMYPLAVTIGGEQSSESGDNIPQYANNQTYYSSTYSSQQTRMNVTWTDDVSISIVRIETNFTGEAVNYTPTQYGNLYSLAVALPAGTYYWKSYANDSIGQWNTLPAVTFTINKATPSGSLTSSAGWGLLYPTETTVTYSESNSGDSDVLYRIYSNGIYNGTSVTWTPPIGSYLYKLNTTVGPFQNYSSSYSIYTRTLLSSETGESMLDSVIHLYLNGTEGNISWDTSKTINITGMIESGSSEDSNTSTPINGSCYGHFVFCDSATDKNWDSYMQEQNGGGLYINWTTPVGITNASLRVKIYLTWNFKCWDYLSLAWKDIGTYYGTNVPIGYYITNTIDIPSVCIGNDMIMLNASSTNGNPNANFYEAELEYFYSSLQLYLNNTLQDTTSYFGYLTTGLYNMTLYYPGTANYNPSAVTWWVDVWEYTPINMTNATLCPTGWLDVLNITLWNESTRLISPGSVDITFFSTNAKTGEKSNFSYALRYNWTYQICLYPNYTYYYLDAVAQFYNLSWTGVREWNIYHMNVSGTTQELRLYMLSSAEDAKIGIKLQDSSSYILSGHMIQIQRYYPETNEYLTVVVPKTDSNGETNTYLVPYDVYYRFVVLKDGVVKDIIGPMLVTTSTLTLTATADNVWEYYQFESAVSYSCSYNNDTKYMSCNVINTNGLVTGGCLNVTKKGILSDTEVCYLCSSGSSFSLSCALGDDASGTYSAILEVYPNFPNSIKVLKKSYNWDITGMVVFGLSGVVFAIFIIGSLSFIGIWNPAVGIILSLVGFAAVMILGLIPPLWSVLVTVSFIGIIIIYKVRT